MLDIQPLLCTLTKISDGRVLERTATVVSEGDLHQVTIPILAANPADATDQTLRRYAKDWVKKQGAFNVESRFQPLKGKSWFDDEGKGTPLHGLIELTWWPQPDLSDFEKWEREKHANMKRRRASSD
tara:strand:- start:4 stop:384 length:381 start_codon:yes stop_codon:yes gene_type:complete